MKSKYGVRLRLKRKDDRRFKLTKSQIESIKLLRLKGESLLFIAKLFNISRNSVLRYTNPNCAAGERERNRKRRHTTTKEKADNKRYKRRHIKKLKLKYRKYQRIQARKLREYKKIRGSYEV